MNSSTFWTNALFPVGVSTFKFQFIPQLVQNSNFFIIFCCPRPFLWPPKCASTQYRFSTLHSPPSKGYITKDDSHQRLHSPRWYLSKGCKTQDATHQRLYNQRWHPSKGYTTNDDTTRYHLFLSFPRSFNEYFCVQRNKKITKHSETIRIGTNVEVLVLVKGNPPIHLGLCPRCSVLSPYSWVAPTNTSPSTFVR